MLAMIRASCGEGGGERAIQVRPGRTIHGCRLAQQSRGAYSWKCVAAPQVAERKWAEGRVDVEGRVEVLECG